MSVSYKNEYADKISDVNVRFSQVEIAHFSFRMEASDYCLTIFKYEGEWRPSHIAHMDWKKEPCYFCGKIDVFICEPPQIMAELFRIFTYHKNVRLKCALRFKPLAF